MRGLQFSNLMVQHFIEYMDHQLAVICRIKKKYVLCENIKEIESFKKTKIIYRFKYDKMIEFPIDSIIDECYNENY